MSRDQTGNHAAHKERSELSHYIGNAVKQEHPISESGESQDRSYQDQESVRVMQNIHSIHYLQSIQNQGQPLSLTLPRQQVIMETDAERQSNNSSGGGKPGQ